MLRDTPEISPSGTGPPPRRQVNMDIIKTLFKAITDGLAEILAYFAVQEEQNQTSQQASAGNDTSVDDSIVLKSG